MDSRYESGVSPRIFASMELPRTFTAVTLYLTVTITFRFVNVRKRTCAPVITASVQHAKPAPFTGLTVKRNQIAVSIIIVSTGSVNNASLVIVLRLKRNLKVVRVPSMAAVVIQKRINVSTVHIRLD